MRSRFEQSCISHWIQFRPTRLMCLWAWWGYGGKESCENTSEMKNRPLPLVFLPYSDIKRKKSSGGSEAAIHEKFSSNNKTAWKIAAREKIASRKIHNFFFICLPLRYKFRIREETGIFPNCWVPRSFFTATLFSTRPDYDIKQYFLGFSIPVQCEKIFC